MISRTAFAARTSVVLFAFGIFFLLITIRLFQSSAAVEPPSANSATPENYDLRTDTEKAARKLIESFYAEASRDIVEVSSERLRSEEAGRVLLSRENGTRIERGTDGFPAIIESGRLRSGFFGRTGAGKLRADVLRAFVAENRDLFGSDGKDLRVTADYRNPDGNLAFVSLEQHIGGIPVFQGEINAGFTKRDELFRIVSNLAPNLDNSVASSDFGSPTKAVSDAERHVGVDVLAADTTAVVSSTDGRVTFKSAGSKDLTIASKVYFPIDSGVVRPAWKVMLQGETRGYYVIVDAASGALLWRKNLIEHQTQPATYSVYANTTSMAKTADGPAAYTPGCASPLVCPELALAPRLSFTLIGNEPPYQFNNLGWINDGENRTLGNNIEAGIDRDGINGIDPNGHAVGNPPRNFVFNYNPAPGDPPPGDDPINTVFQMGSVTHAFYMANRWHDETYRLGFTEQALNFQTDNFGRGGLANDSISVEIQDSSATSGANFFTPADGARPRLQLFIWATPNPDRDGGLDSQVGFHELTHGLSNRLHGNATGLLSNMARGMGEGWSDFYALALLSEPTDDPAGNYAVGGYSLFGITPTHASYYYGVRRFPYAIRSSVGPNGLPHNPLTFRYLNADCGTLIGTATENPNSAFPRGSIGASSPCDQTHNMGEVWATALWEVRNQLITRHGSVEGNRRALQYVTDGMKLSPLNPNILQSRDAIIAAATVSDGGDELPVRRGFAIRGLGFFASIQNVGSGNNNTAVTESFVVQGNAVIADGFAVSDQPGNNNGFPEAGESVRITLPLRNSNSVLLTGVTATFRGQTVTYGDIAPGQIVSRTIDGQIPVTAVCGQLFDLVFDITSNVGSATEIRPVRIGVPVGGPSVEFSNTTPVTINAVGASTPYGTSIAVSGMTGRKSIKLELNGLTHTFPGDIDLLLVGPNGQKFIPLSDAGSNSGQTNVVVRLYDSAANLAPSTSLPVAGDWKPTNHAAGDTFPSPAPAVPYESPAPAGTATFATVFGDNAANLNGTWTLYVNDDVAGDSGTLAGWKLIFESEDFLCCTCAMPRTDLGATCTCVQGARSDFDGDGKSDIAVFRPSEGIWYMNRSTAGFGAIRWGTAGDVPVPGDYDGDGKADFVVYRPSADSAQPDFYFLRSSDFTYHGLSWGIPGDIAMTGDFDSDGKDDFAVFRPSGSTFYVLQSFSGSPLVYSGIANAAGKPMAGRFDQDARADFAIFDNGVWRVSGSDNNYTAVVSTNWGLSGDVPVPADYDGDGRDDMAVFRPADRTWYIQFSSGGHAFVPFGLATDIPVPGDYDGDGKDDIAVYRDGIWYINRSTSGMLIASFGLAGDEPLPNSYLP